MPNITFKEAQEIAIAEARRLNAEGGTQKWKTVSMSDNGKWFADECEPNEMKPDFIMGFQRSPYGFDTILENVPKCDCERDAWENSVASVNKIVGELKAIDDSHFTVAEFKKYLMKQDSMGDALYELSPLKIKLAQHNWCKDCKQNQRCEKQYDQSLLQGNALACLNYNGK